MMKTQLSTVFASWMFLVLASLAQAESGLSILPQREIVLHGPDAVQQLVVEDRVDGQYTGDVTDEVEWQSSDPSVVKVEDGMLTPVSDGQATILATRNNQTVEKQIRVHGSGEASNWEFARHVVPVLSRAGCNTGACHGALAGKGNFRLSLRGYFPAGDYHEMTRAARGRRIELSDPGRSLVVAKPAGMIRHKGGLRLKPDSRDYQVVVDWISGGAVGPTDQDAKLESVTVEPELIRLQPGDEQQLIVTATYSDGRVEDVTSWATFSSSDETVLNVDESGLINVIGRGDGAVVVWFSSQLTLSRIAVPFDHQVPQKVYEVAERNNFVDELVLAKLEALNLRPSPRTNDTEFLRRVYLDVIGTLPTTEEVTAFLDDSSSDKRTQVIDDLLARPEFVDYWTHRWSDLLLVNGRRLRPQAVKAYYGWIRDHVANNTPWDEMVTEIITARGSSVENGATNFYALHQDPENMTENVSQAFLGLSIGCAKCHNHPLEKWTNDQYYSMANFFARVKAKGWGGDARSGDGVRTIFAATSGDLIQPLTGVAHPPTPLDGEPLSLDAPGDRREYLAEWMTSPDNPYFSRAIANRVWAALLGKGLVEPVDDLRVSNPARNEALLDALSEHLVEQDFNLKSLMRVILNSETYQRSSQPLPDNLEDRHYFSRYYPRRLSAEILLDAIAQVTQVPTKFTQIGYDGNDFEKTEAYPPGTRAIQLADSAVVSNFLKTFGRNERDITCECERSDTPSMVQVLHISNGVTINERLRDPQSCVQNAIAEELPVAEVVQQAFLATLARHPTESELDQLSQVIQQTPADERVTALEDLYWGIMSTREFLFNH